jgi:hypothetical protein
VLPLTDSVNSTVTIRSTRSLLPASCRPDFAAAVLAVLARTFDRRQARGTPWKRRPELTGDDPVEAAMQPTGPATGRRVRRNGRR